MYYLYYVTYRVLGQEFNWVQGRSTIPRPAPSAPLAHGRPVMPGPASWQPSHGRAHAAVLRIDVPGPHPSLAALLDAHFRIRDVETFMSAARTPFVDAQRYIGSGGLFSSLTPARSLAYTCKQGRRAPWKEGRVMAQVPFTPLRPTCHVAARGTVRDLPRPRLRRTMT